MTAARTKVEQFEDFRPHLLAVATRLLGSRSEADDAIQETWLRFDQAEVEQIDNLGGWLTTVISRICLDHLRSRAKWSDDPVELAATELVNDEPGPEDAAILAEASAAALGIVLDSLSPLERVAFILHDAFAVPFEDVAAVIDRSLVATRQLASRARRKVREASGTTRQSPRPNREIVTAFFSAAREGRMQDLIQLLAPDVVLRADAMTMDMGVEPERIGAGVVAETFLGGAKAARMATIDGQYGAFWANGGQVQVVFQFTIDRDQITAIDMVADREVIAAMEIEPGIVRYRTANQSRSQHK
jgi:RNA polymerase sigma factor (sigma-70 family)